MTNANLLNARNAYRRKKGLLTSNEIIEIRENYGLSQVDLARLLGWGEATIVRYESKAIQDEAYDTMLHVYPSEQADYSLLSETERKVLDAVIDKFRDYKASEIVEYMHEERAYKETENGEIIPFWLAKEIREL